MIPYGKQEITDDDVAAVIEVLRSDFITQGPAVPRFETALARYTGAKHAVVANSATSALHLACRVLNLDEGGLLWTSPNTFVASANAARFCGAEVDFVDIDPATFNMDATKLATKLEQAKAENRLPDIVMPVHFGGRSCDMRAIGDLAAEYGFRVIEDASHAIGGRYGGKPIGACEYSDITVFSFHPVKIITTAEGGAAVTNDPDLAERMRLLRSHGTTRDPGTMSGEPDGPWTYEQIDLGYNYRMTDLQAALGCSQLKRLDDYVTRRNELADEYDRRLAELPLTTNERPQAPDLSACHLYVIRLDDDLAPRRRAIFEALRAAGVGVNVHYIPVHTQPYYRALGFGPGDFPEAERYYAGAITLPLHPQLTDTDLEKVVSALSEALR